MGFWQKIYNWFKSLRYPAWLRPYIQDFNDIILKILKEVGEEYIAQLQVKILEVSKLDTSIGNKFDLVFDFGKDLLPAIKDSTLKLIIEALYNRLKENRVV